MSLLAITPNKTEVRSPVPAPSRLPLDFHTRFPGYAPSPLVDASELAHQLGIGRLLIKDESLRMGLPSFKILGASWAIFRALEEYRGRAFDPWNSLADLAEQLSPLGELMLIAATDGNHGRAVARVARLLGLSSHIFVPRDMATARIEAIRGEGALLTVVDGTYDRAIELSAEQAKDGCLVISDTSWEGYERVPGWIIDGYATIFWEVDRQIQDAELRAPDVVFVQIGVGALAAAVTRHYRRPALSHLPTLVGVEPDAADCVRSSIEAGELVAMPGPHRSIMAGLNCGKPSPIAWPTLKAGIDLFVTLSDDAARSGMRDLASVGVVSGETGAAGMGALREMAVSPEPAPLALTPDTSVLVISTEGATDPEAYSRIVGLDPRVIEATDGP